MSLATRCPACGTIFRVVQDQLKVSEGWVRCGQCHEVFHGIEALFDLDSDPAVAARRAATRGPAAPPPTRVFAEQRASAPVPIPVPASPAPSPVAIPARTPAPVSSAPQSVPATPSAFGASGFPPPASATRPGYTGFTPATRPMPPLPPPPAPQPPPLAPSPPPSMAAPSPIPGIVTRGTIAPRFAARLAEESARAQAATPSPASVAPVQAPAAHVPPPAAYAPSPAAASPIDQAPWQASAAPGWQAPVDVPPAPRPDAYAPATRPSAPYVAPIAPEPATPPAFAPTPAYAETPLVTPIGASSAPSAHEPAAPSAADRASQFAAPAAQAASPAREIPSPAAATAQPAATALPTARDKASDLGGSTMPSLLAEDAADDPRAGPPTLASMLPEDAGDWPPRRARKRPADATGTTSELALVDRSKDPRFLREARSGARWRKPWVRAVLSVALLLLVVAAAGQVAWPMRDTIASRWPATLPAWNWLCAQADCRIEAPRAIASLALDGSSLTRTDADHVLLFSADLHNRADHEVRMPSFDVTFMDLNGEIVARKVLTPEQLGIHRASLPAEGELHVHARLQVGALPASGFQADLFYP